MFSRPKDTKDGSATSSPPRETSRRGVTATKPLKIGVIGFGKFGQFIAETFSKDHDVFAMGRGDHTIAARELGEPHRAVTVLQLYMYCMGHSVCFWYSTRWGV